MSDAGELFAGRYRIERRLGSGGMGEVFLVRHVQLDEPRALKRMRPEVTEDKSLVERFRREARQHSRVRHPNVVTLYDFEELPDGTCYLVMEYVEGRTLEAAWREEPPALARAVGIITQVASAIDAAHEVGVVHRDLKPDNILLTAGRDGTDRVKVVDFGVAVLMQDEATRLTSAGFVIGTPRYMSPEQLLPTPGEPLDGRSDVYSLALIAWELLAGAPPFASDTLAEVMARTMSKPPSIAGRDVARRLPATLDPVFARALASDRNDRYPTAGAFADAMVTVLVDAGLVQRQNIAVPTPWQGAEVIVRGTSPAVAAAAPPRGDIGRRTPVALIALGAVLLLGVGALVWRAGTSRVGARGASDAATAPATSAGTRAAPTAPNAMGAGKRAPATMQANANANPNARREASDRSGQAGRRDGPARSSVADDSVLQSLALAPAPSTEADAIQRMQRIIAVLPRLRTRRDSVEAELLTIEALAQLGEEAKICSRLPALMRQASGTPLEASVTYWRENLTCPL